MKNKHIKLFEQFYDHYDELDMYKDIDKKSYDKYKDKLKDLDYLPYINFDKINKEDISTVSDMLGLDLDEDELGSILDLLKSSNEDSKELGKELYNTLGYKKLSEEIRDVFNYIIYEKSFKDEKYLKDLKNDIIHYVEGLDDLLFTYGYLMKRGYKIEPHPFFKKVEDYYFNYLS